MTCEDQYTSSDSEFHLSARSTAHRLNDIEASHSQFGNFAYSSPFTSPQHLPAAQRPNLPSTSHGKLQKSTLKFSLQGIDREIKSTALGPSSSQFDATFKPQTSRCSPRETSRVDEIPGASPSDKPDSPRSPPITSPRANGLVVSPAADHRLQVSAPDGIDLQLIIAPDSQPSCAVCGYVPRSSVSHLSKVRSLTILMRNPTASDQADSAVEPDKGDGDPPSRATRASKLKTTGQPVRTSFDLVHQV